jgi:hypothetical protein
VRVRAAGLMAEQAVNPCGFALVASHGFFSSRVHCGLHYPISLTEDLITRNSTFVLKLDRWTSTRRAAGLA